MPQVSVYQTRKIWLAILILFGLSSTEAAFAQQDCSDASNHCYFGPISRIIMTGDDQAQITIGSEKYGITGRSHVDLAIVALEKDFECEIRAARQGISYDRINTRHTIECWK